MEWETPRVTVIDMNAEIGSYQGDFEDEPTAPDLESEHAHAEASSRYSE